MAKSISTSLLSKKQSILPGIMSFNSITANNDIDKVELFNTQFSLHLATDVYSSPDTIHNDPPILGTVDIDEQVVFNNLCALDSTKSHWY